MRRQVPLLHLLDDVIGHTFELVGRCILDARRVADEQVMWRGIDVDLAAPADPTPFRAMHVPLYANLHAPITTFFNAKSPVACDVRHAVDATVKESLKVALVPKGTAEDRNLCVGCSQFFTLLCPRENVLPFDPTCEPVDGRGMRVLL